MKTFQCYKKVKADEIVKIDRGQTSRIYLKDGDFADVDLAWMEKHRPATGGYFVRYEDGYESYSPKDVFEQGYELFDRRKTLEGFLELHMERGDREFVVNVGHRLTIRPLGRGDFMEFSVDGNHLKRM